MTKNIGDELAQLGRKRIVLEQLLQFARQITRLQGGVEAVQQMLKPSQNPGRLTAAIAELHKQFATTDNADLQKRLQLLDRVIAVEFANIMALSKLSHAEFCAKYAQVSGDSNAHKAIEILEAQVLSFRRKGQTNVAIRYLLHERGVQLAAAKLPITQEQVSERLDALREEESHCRQRIKSEMTGMLDDVNLFLQNEAYPDAMKADFHIARDSLERNLQLLAQGCSLEELPTIVESFELDESSLARTSAATKPSLTITDSGDVSPESHKPETASPTVVVRTVSKPQTTTNPEVLPKPLSFFQKLHKWLQTPWHVKWKDLDPPQ